LDGLTISTFADILVAIGTIYLAYTTSKSTKEMIKQRTPDIKIAPSTNWSEKYKFRSKPENEYADETNDLGSELVLITVFKVLNRGQRAVTLDKFEIWHENTERINVIPIFRDHYEKSSETENKRIYVMSNLPTKPLPYDLLPGKIYLLFIYANNISKALTKKHYSGDVKLFGRFIDSIGESYESEPYYFDIENQDKRASEEMFD
jgi:hypothetical protein